MKTCAICGGSKSLFSLTISGDEDNGGEDYQRDVCGKCWDVIANIALLAMRGEIDALKVRIEQVSHPNPSGFLGSKANSR